MLVLILAIIQNSIIMFNNLHINAFVKMKFHITCKHAYVHVLVRVCVYVCVSMYAFLREASLCVCVCVCVHE